MFSMPTRRPRSSPSSGVAADSAAYGEWYDFTIDPARVAQVLLEVDETSYRGGVMGPRHPITWAHEFDGGRAWYTGMGHTAESYAEPAFERHLLGGIRWAAGWAR